MSHSFHGRHERHLMRQRGAGARTLDATFGFNFNASQRIGSIAPRPKTPAKTPAKTTAKTLAKTPGKTPGRSKTVASRTPAKTPLIILAHTPVRNITKDLTKTPTTIRKSSRKLAWDASSLPTVGDGLTETLSTRSISRMPARTPKIEKRRTPASDKRVSIVSNKQASPMHLESNTVHSAAQTHPEEDCPILEHTDPIAEEPATALIPVQDDVCLPIDEVDDIPEPITEEIPKKESKKRKATTRKKRKPVTMPKPKPKRKVQAKPKAQEDIQDSRVPEACAHVRTSAVEPKPLKASSSRTKKAVQESVQPTNMPENVVHKPRRGLKRQRDDDDDGVPPLKDTISQISVSQARHSPSSRHSPSLRKAEEEERALHARLKRQKLGGVDPRTARIREGRRRISRSKQFTVAEDTLSTSGTVSSYTSPAGGRRGRMLDDFGAQKRQPLGGRDSNATPPPAKRKDLIARKKSTRNWD